MAQKSPLVTRPLGAAAMQRIRDGAVTEYRAHPGSLLDELCYLVVQLQGEPGKIAVFERESEALSALAHSRDCLLLRFPASAARGLPSRISGQVTERLHCPPGLEVIDPVVLALAESLLEAADDRAHRRPAFVEHVQRALVIHLAARFGEPRLVPQELEPAWLARACELLSVADEQASVEQVAEACGLSASAFSRAFRKHAGLPPHRFQVRARIEQAKKLLAGNASLTQVALKCGFADQSHFSRVFRALTGATPRRFRAALGRAHG